MHTNQHESEITRHTSHVTRHASRHRFLTMPQELTTQLVTRNELELFLNDQGLRPSMGGLLADRQYALPLRGWIMGVFTPFWKDLCRQLDIHKYAPERNDCDKSSRLAAAWSKILRGLREITKALIETFASAIQLHTLGRLVS